VLEEHIIHQSANRHHLLMGADRDLVIIAAMLCAYIGISLDAWWGYVFALCVWFASIFGLQLMAKADPLMSGVFIRYFLKYRKFYPAKSDVFSECNHTRNSWR
jgi:type IV secretory pathway TrbD component